jgi:hypothetical protein
MSPRAYHCWTPAEERMLRDMTIAGHTAAECGAAIGVSIGSVTNKREHQRSGPLIMARETIRPVAEYRAPDGPTLVEVLAPMASQDESEGEFLERVLKSANRSIERAAVQRHARIRIASDVPIALCISSDWHASTTGTDVDALLALADLVAQTPGLYSVAVGDLFDNPIKHGGSDVGGVADQLRLLDIIVGRYRGKLLGTTSGNHDDWSKVLSGQDALKALAIRQRIHYAPDELLWQVEITSPHDPDEVTASYLIATRHQWRRHSNLNPTHACKTWLQEQQMNWETIPDVLAIGHNHVAAIGSEQYAGRDVHYLRMGSFQRDSAYARAKGFADYRSTAPTVVLPPTRAQRIQCFADPVDAIQHMRGWRDVAA